MTKFYRSGQMRRSQANAGSVLVTYEPWRDSFGGKQGFCRVYRETESSTYYPSTAELVLSLTRPNAIQLARSILSAVREGDDHCPPTQFQVKNDETDEALLEGEETP